MMIRRAASQITNRLKRTLQIRQMAGGHDAKLPGVRTACLAIALM
jgi:hypothetical protein